MVKPLFAAAAALALMAAAPADLDAATAPLIKRAELAAARGDWAGAIPDLRAVRDLAAKRVGENDPVTLHAGVQLTQALTQAGQYEQAIAEGMGPLRAFSAAATKANVDGLYLRYYLAQAFTNCRAARCGEESHRLGNVDALMEALMAGLATYPRGDKTVADLRTSFTQTCTQRYEPADCATANGK